MTEAEESFFEQTANSGLETFAPLPTPDGEIGELVAKLREAKAKWSLNPVLVETINEAATALETQAADIARLREALERLIGASKTVAGYCDMLEPGTEIFAAIEQGSTTLATKETHP